MKTRFDLGLSGLLSGILLVACSSDSMTGDSLVDAGGPGAAGGRGGAAPGSGGAGTGGAHSGGGGAGTGGAHSGGANAGTGGANSGGASAGGTTIVPVDAAIPGADDDGGDAEAGASGGASDAGDGDGPEPQWPKRVFITHAHWDGNLLQAARALGIDVATGIAAADALCQRAAADAGLGGVWVAWLSDFTHDAIDRVADVGPWYRVDGAEVFPDKAALAGNPLVSIELDEFGDDTELYPDGGGLANVPWTGTIADGTRAAENCNDWENDWASIHGLAGANTATTDRKWSEGTAPECDDPYHLYCFEQ